jgi:hypothetical protein
MGTMNSLFIESFCFGDATDVSNDTLRLCRSFVEGKGTGKGDKGVRRDLRRAGDKGGMLDEDFSLVMTVLVRFLEVIFECDGENMIPYVWNLFELLGKISFCCLNVVVK